MHLSYNTLMRFISLLKQYGALIPFAAVFLFLYFSTYHGDLYYVNLFSQKITQGNFNVYEKVFSLGDNYVRSDENLDAPIFPPFALFFDALFFYVFKIVGLYSFDVRDVANNHIILALLKAKFLIFALLSGCVMWLIGKELFPANATSRLHFLLMFIASPFLAFTFVQGNMDIYPMFFTLLFILAVVKKQYTGAFVALGLAAGLKNYALLLVLPAAIIIAKGNWHRFLIYFAIAVGVYIVSILLYLPAAKHFILAGGESLFLLHYTIPREILIYPFLYGLIIIYLLFFYRFKQQVDTTLLWKTLFTVIGLIFLTSSYHPQWILWLLPFFILTLRSLRSFFFYFIYACAFFFHLVTNWHYNLDYRVFEITFPWLKYVYSWNNFVNDEMYITITRIVITFMAIALTGYLLSIWIKDAADKKSVEDISANKIIVFSLLPLLIYVLVNTAYIGAYLYKKNEYNKIIFHTETPLTQSIKAQTLSQTFPIYEKQLQGIMFTLSTPYPTEATVSILDESCKTELTRKQISITKNEGLTEVNFNPIKPGRKACLRIQFKAQQQITFTSTPLNTYKDFHLIVDGKIQPIDLMLQTLHPIVSWGKFK